MGDGAVTFGGSPDGDGEGIGGTGALDPDRSMGCTSWVRGSGFACKDGRRGKVYAGISCIVTVGGSPDIDGDGNGCTGAWDPDGSIGCTSWVHRDGLACMEVRRGSVSWGFSCKLERERGEGVVISNVDAAQSQWVDRAP